MRLNHKELQYETIQTIREIGSIRVFAETVRIQSSKIFKL